VNDNLVAMSVGADGRIVLAGRAPSVPYASGVTSSSYLDTDRVARLTPDGHARQRVRFLGPEGPHLVLLGRVTTRIEDVAVLPRRGGRYGRPLTVI